MSSDKFKLPNSSYEEITKIIKAYGHFDEAASLDDVSKLISMNNTVISRNIGFLLEIDILTPGKKKALTKEGKDLARALEHEMPDEIRQSWNKLIENNEFLSKLLAAIKIRNGMDENTFQSHIAYSAGQPKKPQFMTGARTIIDILKASEVLIEEDGKFTLSKNLKSSTVHGNANTQTQGATIEKKIETKSISKPEGAFIVHENNEHGLKISIDVRVNCDFQDLDQLGGKLKKVIEEINSRDDNKTDEAN